MVIYTVKVELFEGSQIIGQFFFLHPLIFLWGYLKERVYKTPPASLQELENRVRAEVRALRRRNRGMVRRAMYQMMARANICIQRNGGHVEGRL